MKKVKTTARLLFLSGKSFVENRGSISAAAVAYYLIISAIPLLILAISVATFVFKFQETIITWLLQLANYVNPSLGEMIHSLVSKIFQGKEATQEILSFAASFNPVAVQAGEDFLAKLVDNKGVTTQIGFLGLIWSGSKIFQTLENALNLAWRAPVRKIYKSWMISFVIAMSLGILPMISILLTLASKLINKFGGLLMLSAPDMKNLGIILNIIVPVALSVVMFTFIYRILPNCKTRWSSCFIGGLTTGLLFEATKQLFAFYLANFASYDKLYGSIAGIIALVFWAYYAGLITVFGAEMSYQFDFLRHGKRSDEVDPTGKLIVATEVAQPQVVAST